MEKKRVNFLDLIVFHNLTAHNMTLLMQNKSLTISVYDCQCFHTR